MLLKMLSQEFVSCKRFLSFLNQSSSAVAMPVGSSWDSRSQKERHYKHDKRKQRNMRRVSLRNQISSVIEKLRYMSESLIFRFVSWEAMIVCIKDFKWLWIKRICHIYSLESNSLTEGVSIRYLWYTSTVPAIFCYDPLSMICFFLVRLCFRLKFCFLSPEEYKSHWRYHRRNRCRFLLLVAKESSLRHVRSV